jgi:hypothetical protein
MNGAAVAAASQHKPSKKQTLLSSRAKALAVSLHCLHPCLALTAWTVPPVCVHPVASPVQVSVLQVSNSELQATL